MSSEVNSWAAYEEPSTDSYHRPSLDASAVPTARAYDVRSHKRIRVASNVLPCASTESSGHAGWGQPGSAQSLNGAFPARCVSSSTSISQNERPRSVPPPTKRGRKKKSKQNTQDGSWIQESFAFPAQQTWLRVKPRQRKAAVTAEPHQDVEFNSSVAPSEGEALCLDKHADRIAALIAQKRRDNESKLFRERMSLQQRLHRGEADHKDKVIAAGHDELKRKMELSAKGIFEEQPPDGRERILTLDPRHSASLHLPSRQSSVASVESGTSPVASPSPSLAHLNTQYPEDRSFSMSNTHDLYIHEELGRHDPDDSYEEEIIRTELLDAPRHSGPALAATVEAPSISGHYEQALHQPSQISVTGQTYVASDALSGSETTHLFLTQPRSTNQRDHNPHMWQPQPEQRTISQPWTSQMFRALPSTSTPLLQSREISAESRQADVDAQHNMSFELFGPGLSSDVYGSFQDAGLHSDEVPSGDQCQPPVLRSNMNMFTRQTRENGVIGGNNNYLELVGEGGKRRNMFDNRI